MDNVILIGMPGCGKSTVGVVLAKSLGFGFVDTDLIICEQQGQKLQRLIDQKGIDKFLEIEEQTGLNLNCKNTVVATGGSMVISEKAMEHLKSMGKVVYINVPLKELKNRITNMKTRGIVFKKGETLDDIFKTRTPLYEKYADLTVNVTKEGSLENTVSKIVSGLNG